MEIVCLDYQYEYIYISLLSLSLSEKKMNYICKKLNDVVIS